MIRIVLVLYVAGWYSIEAQRCVCNKFGAQPVCLGKLETFDSLCDLPCKHLSRFLFQNLLLLKMATVIHHYKFYLLKYTQITVKFKCCQRLQRIKLLMTEFSSHIFFLIIDITRGVR